jgi:uncharacterized protein YggE
MSDTLITVRGRFSARYPAECATVSLSVGFDGAERDAAFSLVMASAETVRGRITIAHQATDGPITSWSSDTVQVWSDRPWNQDGRQLDPVFHARIGFSARFGDVTLLARFVEDVAAIDGVSIGSLTWHLTDTTRSTAVIEARSRAVKDAVATATIYAQSIGLGHVRAISLADEGMLGDPAGEPTGPTAAFVRTASIAADGPVLSLKPEEIEITAVVDARFVAS